MNVIHECHGMCLTGPDSTGTLCRMLSPRAEAGPEASKLNDESSLTEEEASRVSHTHPMSVSAVLRLRDAQSA